MSKVEFSDDDSSVISSSDNEFDTSDLKFLASRIDSSDVKFDSDEFRTLLSEYITANDIRVKEEWRNLSKKFVENLLDQVKIEICTHTPLSEFNSKGLKNPVATALSEAVKSGCLFCVCQMALVFPLICRMRYKQTPDYHRRYETQPEFFEELAGTHVLGTVLDSKHPLAVKVKMLDLLLGNARPEFNLRKHGCLVFAELPGKDLENAQQFTYLWIGMVLRGIVPLREDLMEIPRKLKEYGVSLATSYYECFVPLVKECPSELKHAYNSEIVKTDEIVSWVKRTHYKDC